MRYAYALQEKFQFKKNYSPQHRITKSIPTRISIRLVSSMVELLSTHSMIGTSLFGLDTALLLLLELSHASAACWDGELLLLLLASCDDDGRRSLLFSGVTSDGGGTSGLLIYNCTRFRDVTYRDCFPLSHTGVRRC